MSAIPLDILIEAKREVISYAKQGRLLTPSDAWMLSGHIAGNQTLWSIARKVAWDNNVSAEELCAYLEKQYPQHAGHASQTVEWHDIIHKTKH